MQLDIQFEVQGCAVPKQSTRFADGHTYRDPKVTAWQDTVVMMAKQALMANPKFEILKGPVGIQYTFYLSDKRIRDYDNLAKGVSDALKGFLFKDDSQISDARILKIYEKPARVWIHVWEIGGIL